MTCLALQARTEAHLHTLRTSPMKGSVVDLGLTIVVAGPATGHAFCLQRGKGAKAERLDYVEAADEDIAFDLTVTVRQGKLPDLPDFAGPFVQGPPGGRFFYLCVGRCSLTAEPHWVGRVKVPLNTITWPVVRAATNTGGRLEARYTASRPDGRPVLASVKLLDDGWTVA